MGNRSNLYFFLAIFFLIALSSCRNTMYLTSTQPSLLVKNKIEIDSEDDFFNKRILKDEIKTIPVQKPNKKILGIYPLRLWFYNIANKKKGKKKRKFRKWVADRVGEPPVVFDSTLMYQSTDLLTNYFRNKGFFHAHTRASFTTKKKKTIVRYVIEPDKAYRYRQVLPTSGHTIIDSILGAGHKKTQIEKGKNFNVSVLKEERKRVASLLRDHGYYYFDKDYVHFDLDTSIGTYELDIYTLLDTTKDSIYNKICHIGDIYIHSDYSINNQKTIYKKDTQRIDEFTFYTHKKAVRPKTIKRALFFQKGEMYRESDYKSTIRRLNELGVFRFVNIKFEEKKHGDTTALDCHIYLKPLKKHVLSTSVEANNDFQGLLGSGITFGYSNRNLSRRADQLDIRLTGGVELNLSRKTNQSIVNTADVISEIKYSIDRFLFPHSKKRDFRELNPKTNFSLQYNYENRIQFYALHATLLSFGYEWRKKNRRHVFNPISVSLILIPDSSRTQAFLDRLQQSASLRLSFEEQLIIGGNYTFYVDNKTSASDQTYVSFTGNIDMAGNLIHSFVLLSKQAKNNSPPYKLIGREYAQYARFETDTRYYLRINDNSSFVTRLNIGVGIAYGNAQVMPYGKQFYIGGPNSIRAFRVRSIGPGIYSGNDESSLFIDQTGDFKMEANFEYRFGVFKWLKGAVFLDMGNIWTLRPDSSRPGAQISRDFYKQVALGTGLGARLDFKFFIFRFDVGVPVYNPTLPEGTRFVLRDANLGSRDWRRENFTYNLAIGYPF